MNLMLGDIRLNQKEQETHVSILKTSPKRCAPQEVEAHQTPGRVQHGSWCRFCAAVRGIGHQHRSSVEDDEAIPSVSCDHACMGVDVSLDTIPHLLIRGHTTTANAATTFFKTGVHQHAVQFSVGFMRDLRCEEGEGILFVRCRLLCVTQCQMWMIFKGGLVGDRAADGQAENADKVVKRQVRC